MYLRMKKGDVLRVFRRSWVLLGFEKFLLVD